MSRPSVFLCHGSRPGVVRTASFAGGRRMLSIRDVTTGDGGGRIPRGSIRRCPNPASPEPNAGRELGVGASWESGIREPAAGWRTILRRFVEDFTGKGLRADRRLAPRRRQVRPAQGDLRPAAGGGGDGTGRRSAVPLLARSEPEGRPCAGPPGGSGGRDRARPRGRPGRGLGEDRAPDAAVAGRRRVGGLDRRSGVCRVLRGRGAGGGTFVRTKRNSSPRSVPPRNRLPRDGGLSASTSINALFAAAFLPGPMMGGLQHPRASSCARG